MALPDSEDGRFDMLRQKAEALIDKKGDAPDGAPMEMLDLIQELRVHQVELTIQNEELQAAQQDLSELNREYVELYYENAPCGYVSLDPYGLITRLNSTAFRLLGAGDDHRRMIGMPFAHFLDPKGEQVYLSLRQQSLQADEVRHGELQLKRPEDQPFWVRADLVMDRDDSGRVGGHRLTMVDVTERKQTEEALRQSRKDLDRAQAVGQIGWWRLDTRRNVLTWSAENYRIFGVPEGTPMSYESFLSIVHPDDRRYVNAQWQAALRGEPYDIEHRIVVDGKARWVREKAYLEFNDEGQLKGGFGIAQDITHQKISEKALRRSERRLSMAVSATADAVWEWNLVTNETYYSPRWYEMLGYADGEIQMDFNGWKRLCHPDDFKPTVDLVRSRLDSSDDKSYEAEFRMRTKDGSWMWILGRGRVVERDAAGRPVLLSGTNTDISERKNTEKKLRQLSQFPEENPNPVLRIAVDRTVLYMNSPARQMLSVMGWRDGLPLPTSLKAVLARVREQGQTEVSEITLPDDRTFSFVAIQPLDEAYINFYGMDITHRKRAEKALHESEAQLKARLSEKEVMLKEIHHRVKNNMQVISSLVDLQIDDVRDPAMRGIFQEVKHRVRSMAMVHEKLYQSRDLARVDFADYTKTLLGYLWRSQGIEGSGLRLDLDLAPVLLPVNQAVPCGLVLNELFSNALKHAFTGRDKGRVSVSLQKNGEGRVRLEVKDDGVGLPDGLQWRSAPSLGLRLVQMLSHQLKATVEVKGEVGTIFTLTFKRTQA